MSHAVVLLASYLNALETTHTAQNTSLKKIKRSPINPDTAKHGFEDLMRCVNFLYKLLSVFVHQRRSKMEGNACAESHPDSRLTGFYNKLIHTQLLAETIQYSTGPACNTAPPVKPAVGGICHVLQVYVLSPLLQVNNTAYLYSTYLLFTSEHMQGSTLTERHIRDSGSILCAPLQKFISNT